MASYGSHTSLRGAEVFAGSGSAGTSTASLLDAQGAAINDLALKTILGSVGLVGSDHLDEAEAARLLAVGVAHDLALLDLAVLLEHAGDLSLSKAGVDARHEEVRAGVNCAVIIVVDRTRTAVVLWSGMVGKEKEIVRSVVLYGKKARREKKIGRAIVCTCRRQRREKLSGGERSPGPRRDAETHYAARRGRNGHRPLVDG